MNLVKKAKSLRKEMTDAEKSLWYILKSKNFQGLKFRRQEPIGEYIVDFVCFGIKLVIELDGGQHANLTIEEDKERDEWLRSQGFTVLRFWNNDVLENRDGVLEEILKNIKTPSPDPSHLGRGKFRVLRSLRDLR